jgi:diguanylate cyclase (GGDEF)-like protein
MIQRGWWIAALSALSALVLALAWDYATPPLYRVSARFVISPNIETANGRDLVNSLATLDKRSIASTFAEVLDSERIYRETGAALKLDESQLRAYALSVVVLPDANVLELAVTGPDPRIAALLANNVGQQGIDYVTALYQVYRITFLDTATASAKPVSPNAVRDASLAFALGLVAGGLLSILREQLRIPLEGLWRRAVTDSVSSAYTRTHTLRRLEELSRNKGKGISLGLVQFNGLRDLIETLPQPIAQRLLRRVVAVFREELRGSDIVGRWNDISFIVVLPDTPEMAAARTVERIQRALSSPLEIDQIDFDLEPRFGVVTRQGEETVESFVTRAEAVLEHTRLSDTNAIVALSAKTVRAVSF